MLLTVFATLGVGYFYYVLETGYSEDEGGTISVLVIVDYADVLPTENHSGIFLKGVTVFEVTNFFANLGIKNYSSLGILVEEINSVRSNVNLTNYYWFYYVNGVLGDRACNIFHLETNSTITWKYEPLSG